jgi:hypothetical protein
MCWAKQGEQITTCPKIIAGGSSASIDERASKTPAPLIFKLAEPFIS